jgi:VWFA-related protein
MINQAPLRTTYMLIVSFCLTMALSAQTTDPSTTKVSIPVLVELGSGELASDLSAANFSLRDNGIEQRIQLDRDEATKPIALLIVIQTGHDATKALTQIARLSDLLDSVLVNPRDQVSVLTFDGSPQVAQGFTLDRETTANTLSSISKGNSRAALFDAMNMAIGYFRRAPADDQRVIFLISGDHDYGSVGSDMNALIHDASSSEVSIYSFSFRAGDGQLFGRLRALNPLDMAANATRRDAGAALAGLTGGEFYRFNSEATFENCVEKVANHLRNRYTLTFEPNRSQPGLHTVQVSVNAPGANVVGAREIYWTSAGNAP